jgi:hypothetical protein
VCGFTVPVFAQCRNLRAAAQFRTSALRTDGSASLRREQRQLNPWMPHDDPALSGKVIVGRLSAITEPLQSLLTLGIGGAYKYHRAKDASRFEVK